MIARPDHLGDVLLTVPAAAALRAVIPDAHISFLVTTAFGDLLGRCPDIDQTYTLPFPQLVSAQNSAGWTEVVGRNVARLRDRFDVAILSRPEDPWSGEAVAAAGVPLRVGYATPGTEQFLNLPVDFYEEGHAVVQTLKLIEAAAARLGATVNGGLVESATGRLVPTQADEAIAEAILSEASEAGARPVVFQIGSGWPLKNWVPARWGELAIELRRRWGLMPLVPGGPGEDALVAAVVEASRGCAYGLAGRLPLGPLAALYRRASIVIGLDSGPVHLAAMVGTPVVALHGPLDPLKWGPWCPPQRRRVVQVSLPCSPCDCIFDPPCGVPIEPDCCTGITVEAVVAAAEDLLGLRE